MVQPRPLSAPGEPFLGLVQPEGAPVGYTRAPWEGGNSAHLVSASRVTSGKSCRLLRHGPLALTWPPLREAVEQGISFLLLSAAPPPPQAEEQLSCGLVTQSVLTGYLCKLETSTVRWALGSPWGWLQCVVGILATHTRDLD